MTDAAIEELARQAWEEDPDLSPEPWGSPAASLYLEGFRAGYMAFAVRNFRP